MKLYFTFFVVLYALIPLAQADEPINQDIQAFNDAAELAHVTCQPHDPFRPVSTEQELQSVYEDSLNCIDEHFISIKGTYDLAHKSLAYNPAASANLDDYYNKWIESMKALVPEVNENESAYNLKKYGLNNQAIEIWANLASQIGI